MAFVSDASSVERCLFASRGCAECHGVNGAGKAFLDQPGRRRRGGALQPDWVRTVRHGVKPDGTPLFIMPSDDHARFSDADLAALTALMRTGKRPDGTAVAVMPFESLGQMNDTDLKALQLCLQSLAPHAAGGR